MRLSSMFVPTRKEDPAEAEVVSHQLLVRGGYIRMLARGIYDFLPLGWRSVRKIEQIVREEMDRAGAQEVHMPAVQPAELWQESGRWVEYGAELLRFRDRKGAEFCMGPTHEEVVTDMIRGDVKSYKQLPLNLYQIQTKFRDETRPRFGLMRGREFVMKDAYSFDVDEAGALKSYDTMFDAYHRIFQRLGFEYRAVEADTGNIGGSRSHEFQVLAETGEDEIVSCTECGYAANVEKAEIRVEIAEAGEPSGSELATLRTPKARTIEEVSNYLKRGPELIVKTLVYMADETPVMVLMRGDHQVNEIKLKAYLNGELQREVQDLRLASDSEVEEITKAPVGFAGPVGVEGVEIFADLAVEPMVDFIVGANLKDKHHVNVNHGRDFEVKAFVDLRQAGAGDICGRCGGVLEAHRGIEVGHVFFLGDKYSRAMNANVLDEAGEHKPMQMGCYGIGVTRILAAVIEQNHDENGIIWPMAIAPYQVVICPLHLKNELVVSESERIYSELKAAGIEVMLDDRDLRAGNKFKDADLIGIPVRITLGGRGVENGEVELKLRSEDEQTLVALGDIVDRVKVLVAEALVGARGER
ncbi:proline--tRNA ligase [Lujinxingia litoralis]|uniref:Proline--tRNA ligase n=1 Tax=Lujinxingia litoralis TaxID=2211119 RepID=A0A328C7K7_9DELT|nr:proline--tRNA ligase [Lujinxingia litoralis]RAL23853.1 proline--tRNA ligase [Lujinxingia litoralis]